MSDTKNDPTSEPAPKRGFPKGDKAAVMATVVLSNGAVAEMRRPIGRDLVRANHLSGGKSDTEVGIALISILTRVDGERISYDDVLDGPAEDVAVLSAEVGKFLGTAPATS